MATLSLPLILVALAGAISVLLLMMAALGALRSRKSDDPNDDPRCGACGCIIANPAGGICPTCRCSLPVVGLVLPFSSKRSPRWTSRQAFFKVSALPLAIWTICMTGLAVGGTFAIDQWLLPYVWQTTSTVQAHSRSRGCQAITIVTIEEYRAQGKARFDSPDSRKTSLLELKTDSGIHQFRVNLLAPSFEYTDASGSQVRQDRLPAKDDVIALMRASGITINANATQEAGILASTLANFTPPESLVISTRDQRRSPTLDTTHLAFSGGQWKAAIALPPLAMSIASGIWFFGFVLIIWLQRKRRAKLAAALLAPPVVTAPLPSSASDEAIGGWDITLDGQDPFLKVAPPPQLPPTVPQLRIKSA